MSSIARFAIVLALGFSFAMFNPAANSQTPTTKKAATGTVAGRITIHGKGAPGIVVISRSQNPSGRETAPLPKATSDDDGNYRIADVPAGNYQVTPMAPAYTTADWLSLRSRGKPLLLAEGEDVQGIDFSLVRGGVITGKVTDADGRPVVEQRLTVVSEDQANARYQGAVPAISAAFQTDDRGIYRVYGIPAGRYKISIGLSEADYYSGRVGRVSYKRTFYPDATDPNQAKVIELTEGTEATNIDITVGRNLPGFTASGKVVDGETSRAVVGVRFGLRQMINNDEGGFVPGIFAVSNSQGEFRLENVTPGKYAVFIAPQPGSEVRAEAGFFEVVDQDVTGLLIKTVKGLSVSGIVVLEGSNDKTLFAKLAQAKVRAYVRNELSGSGQDSPINPDGSFRVGGLLPGTANFWLAGENGRSPLNFAILRVERDGVAQPHGIEIKSGEQISGVRIVVGYGSGTVRGEIKLENGPLPQGGRVVVWIRKVIATPDGFRTYDADSRGHFLIEGVPAGNYDLYVNVSLPGRPGPNMKQPINVIEGSVSDVVVVVDLKANQEPKP